MRTKIVSASGSQFERVQHRFDLWRKTRKRCSPIPETLWSSAVELAREHGLHRTAQTLRLNYYSLKKRFPLISGAPGRAQKEPTFVELFPPPGVAGHSVCTIEMENVQGGKMKIHVQGLGGTDLAVLSDSFWKAAS
jgi:hypothetical protein